jgi:short-subunit dehydrogenase
MRTIAIYGAGPALGMAVARRFGGEGFRVALVARSRERLDGMVRDLGTDGIEAAGFQADIADQAAALRAADQIEDLFGAIDVLEHSPTPGRPSARPLAGGVASTRPLEVDAAAVAPLLDLYLFTPLALAGRVLPGMRERADGALLFAMGASAKYPIPQYAAAGIALSAVRSYVHTLNAALRGTGVYAGTLLIGATIENSRAHRAGSASGAGAGSQAMPVVPASDLAGRLWDLYERRDYVEDIVVPALGGTAQAEASR